ncbi:MAG TPA: peptidoglycan recognition protein [Acidimicrobiales bacterium]|nr:peptidoglycan recognition protein [Acidimicrobiales bacterium]
MRARSIRFSFAAARRLSTRMAVATVAATLVATGLVALPAGSDLRAEIRDKVHTLVEGRAEVGWERTMDTGHPTQLVGFEWEGSEAGAVEVRAKGPDGWTDWQLVEGDPLEGPDRDSHEWHDRTTAGPVWVGRDVDQVQVRVAEGSLPGLKLHALRAEDPPAGGGGIGTTRPAGAAPSQPGIVSRASWGADESWRSRNPGCSQPLYAPNVRFAITHHTAGTNNYTPADSAAIVRAIYHFHTHTNLWCDIGYNFLVDRFGTVFEGRFGGITSAVVGAHAEGFNTGSTGVAVLGTFMTEAVPQAAYAAVRNVLAWKLALHGVDPHGTITAGGRPIRTIVGHRDVNATACPGDNFYPLLPQLRSDVGTAMGVTNGSTYHPLSPARVLDTRSGIGAPAARLGPKGTIDVKVTGVGGVPASGVTAVALNTTVTDASGPLSWLAVWPKGHPRPLASNLNFTAGVSVPNLVIAKVGDNGSVSIHNDLGTVDVVADVQGWYSNSVESVGSSYVPVNPARILDTRNSTQVGSQGVIDLQVTGVGGVPSSGVTAVALNMTVDRATGPESFLTVWPAGTARPTASNLNFSAGPASTNMVIARVGADGKVSIYNNLGSTDVIADVAGWFASPASPPPGSRYFGISPNRILDTREGAGRLGPGGTIDLTVAGVGGVPGSATSVILNVTVNEPTGVDSFLTLFPAGTARPLASNLNFVSGETIPNLVIVRLQNGRVSIYNNQGTTHVIADVQGWFS